MNSLIRRFKFPIISRSTTRAKALEANGTLGYRRFLRPQISVSHRGFPCIFPDKQGIRIREQEFETVTASAHAAENW
jgi:hypothetical protein